MPKNWKSYQRNETNKMELFQYLSGVIAQSVVDEGKVVITTCNENVLLNLRADNTVVQSEYPLSSCNHEEFDTRVMLHTANAVSQGYNCILIIANDTDIIVLGVSFFTEIGNRESVGVIWNGQEAKIYFHPRHLQYHVS